MEKRDQSRVTYWEQVDADLDENKCAMICENLGETITKFFLLLNNILENIYLNC
ncbi:unnamed protein product [marine sediment metagenome]|uniref:Uncharacterized protein n=1 Tax=marine sediment metagenome TaxID=412755 RepID=X0Z0V0_9ZZZZ